MEIKDLRIFQSVAKHGSVSKAAKELNYVQSHVTARVRLLEATLRTQFFYRTSRGMILNSDGKKLLSYAQRILSTVDEMVKAVQDSDHPAGSLSLGTVETVIKLPIVLSDFHKKYPKVDLSLVTGVTEQLINEVLNYRLEGAFVTAFDHHPLLIQHKVFHEELVIISNKKFVYENLKNEALLVFHSGCSYRARLKNWLQDEGITFPKIMEFGTLETILGGVVSGLGVSLVPRSTVVHLEQDGLIQCYPVPEKYSRISTVFIQRTDTYLTHSMMKFIETITSYNNKKHPAKSVESFHHPLIVAGEVF